MHFVIVGGSDAGIATSPWDPVQMAAQAWEKAKRNGPAASLHLVEQIETAR
jgi:hypothetical protein